MCRRSPICSHARLIRVFVALRVVIGALAICWAIASTVDSRSVRGTTWFTSPISNASCAESVCAVYRYSAARFQFMKTHGSIMVSPPGNPSPWTRGIWKYASSDAIVMSGSSAKYVPPPMA